MKSTVLALTAFFLSTIVAFAHSPLKSTLPVDKSSLMKAPTSVQLVFAKPARVTKVVLVHTHGAASHEDKLQLPSKKFETDFNLNAKFRGKGLYKVLWRALGEDGHALKGEFSFSVEGE